MTEKCKDPNDNTKGRMQQELLQLQSESPKEYWKFIGKLGVGKYRTSRLPREILKDDGTVSKEHSDVLHCWKNKTETLLNSNEEACVDNLRV